MGWNHQLAMVLSHYFFQGFGIHPNGGWLAFNGISEAFKMVFLSFYYTLENEHGSWKSPVWKGSSSSKPSFLGSMLIFRGVYLFLNIHWILGGWNIDQQTNPFEITWGLRRTQAFPVPRPRLYRSGAKNKGLRVQGSNEKNTWLVGLYRGLYYPII